MMACRTAQRMRQEALRPVKDTGLSIEQSPVQCFMVLWGKEPADARNLHRSWFQHSSGQLVSRHADGLLRLSALASIASGGTQ